MREDSDGASVWRAQGRRWRTFAQIWLPVTLLFLVATFFIDDVHWGTRVGAACNVLAGVCFWMLARIGTTADTQSLTVSSFRTRQIPWAEVVELRTDPPGPWAADVLALLTDGSTVTLPAVPAQDLPHLESWQS